MVDDTELLERAIVLACRAHSGQRYPSPEGEPFVLHPLRVMLAVRGGFRAQMAGVLHDVLEDSSVTVDDLRVAGMPDEVVDAVVALTRTSDGSYERYIQRLGANRIACEVKLADLADNLENNRRLAPTPEVRARIDRYEQALARLAAAARGR